MTNYVLSAPAKSGMQKEYETMEAALEAAAKIVVGVPVKRMVTRESGDGGTTYCYRTRREADRDEEGSYTVAVYEASRYEVRAILDAEMTELADEPILITDDEDLAAECAWDESGRQWGVAIVDTQRGTVNWGHAVTRVGEAAPEVRS